MSKKKRVIILSHEAHPTDKSDAYLMHYIRMQWEMDGLEVVELRGPEREVDGDLVFVHVDLTIVPKEYLDFAKSYPLQINAGLGDISKSKVSRNIVKSPSEYAGPVIVKTNLNATGITEKFAREVGIKTPSEKYLDIPASVQMETKEDYKIYPTAKEVPDHIYKNPGLIVEKHFPEIHNGQYWIREWYVCGDAGIDNVEISSAPIFCVGDSRGDLAKPAPQSLRDYRVEMQIDYARIEYVLIDGKLVVYDVNKTIGILPPWKPNRLQLEKETAGKLAPGIYKMLGLH